MSGIRIAEPPEAKAPAKAPAPETPVPEAQYICEWVKEMDDWKLFTRSFVRSTHHQPVLHLPFNMANKQRARSVNSANTGTQKVQDGVQYKEMPPALQQATALILLDEDPTLLFTAFHVIVRELRCVFPGHLPVSQITVNGNSPPKIVSAHRKITGYHIHAAHQGYTAYIQYIPWTGSPDFLAQRISSLRTLQSLLNDLGWYHAHQREFPQASNLGDAALYTTTHDLVQEWIVQNPDMATAPFPEAVFHQDLDTLLLCTWARVWCSLEERSARDVDAWLNRVPPEWLVNDGFYMQGYWRAVEYWGQVVEKLGAWLEKADGEGGGGGELERRRRVVEKLEEWYGNGKRMAVFWQFDESFNWELQTKRAARAAKAASSGGGGENGEDGPPGGGKVLDIDLD